MVVMGRLIVAVIVSVGVAACASNRSASTYSLPYTSIVEKAAPVLLVPNTVSSIGWCISVVGSKGRTTAGNCPTGPTGSSIIEEGWGTGGSPPIGEGYAITRSNIASISVDGGARIPTHRETALPGGLRSVAVQLRGLKNEDNLHFEAFDASGRAVPPNHNGVPLGVDAPVRPLVNPLHPNEGTCRIGTGRFAGLAIQGGNWLVNVEGVRGLLGDPYLTCTSVSYSVNGWPATASVLMDASNPGASPKPLPAMRDIPGRAGIFSAPGMNGEIVGMRVHAGWLIVGGTDGLQNRLKLLTHLHVSIYR